MSQSWEGGSTRRWRKIRAMVLQRDQWRCRLRTEVCITTASCVHHTLGRSVTGDDPRYLVAACAPCNLRIGDPTKHDPPNRSVTRW